MDSDTQGKPLAEIKQFRTRPRLKPTAQDIMADASGVALAGKVAEAQRALRNAVWNAALEEAARALEAMGRLPASKSATMDVAAGAVRTLKTED